MLSRVLVGMFMVSAATSGFAGVAVVTPVKFQKIDRMTHSGTINGTTAPGMTIGYRLEGTSADGQSVNAKIDLSEVGSDLKWVNLRSFNEPCAKLAMLAFSLQKPFEVSFDGGHCQLSK